MGKKIAERKRAREKKKAALKKKQKKQNGSFNKSDFFTYR